MILPLLVLLSAQAVAAPSSVREAPAPRAEKAAAASLSVASRRFTELAEDYWETSMRLSPTNATFLNHPRYHDRLEDNGAEGRKAEARELGRLLGMLQAIERSALSEGERLSWDIMKLQLELAREAPRHKFYQWNVDHMFGPQMWIASVVETAQPMRDAKDVDALLARLEAMPRYFANQIDNLREGLGEGRIAARVAVEKTISQLDEMLETPVEGTPYAAAGKRLPEELRVGQLPRIATAVDRHVKPAYRAYRAFLHDEYLAKARVEGLGLSELPDGADAYRYQIRFHTTLPLTPERLHQIGLDELAAIQEEMKVIAASLGHKGSWKSFNERIRTDRENFYATRAQPLEAAKALVERAQVRLPGYFGLLPQTALLVKPTEEYAEKNATAAHYYPPADDLSRPGIYYVNTYKPETRDRYSMPAVAFHEGVPGHHLQIAIATEQRGLPTFRRQAGFTAFVEGWGLYSERLADEMGLYPDQLSRYGMLTADAWRACRLVVDTGIHALGWSRKRAIEFMKANTAVPEDLIVTEVDRYIIWPGQALAYKVGQREIRALREELRARRGAAFDIRAFHDAVLRNGALPLPVLRELLLGG